MDCGLAEQALSNAHEDGVLCFPLLWMPKNRDGRGRHTQRPKFQMIASAANSSMRMMVRRPIRFKSWDQSNNRPIPGNMGGPGMRRKPDHMHQRLVDAP